MRSRPLEGDAEADVVVLGAGVVGCLAALELARHRQHVIVLAAARVGAEDPTAEVGHIPTGLDLPYVEAVLRFGREQAREIWELHRENHSRLRELLVEIGDDCDYRRDGGFRLALDRPQAVSLADSEETLREDGFSGEFLDHYMLEARFDVRGFAAAYWAADDAAIDARRLLRAVARAAEVHGAVFHEQSPVLDLDLSAGGAEAVTRRGRVRAPLALVALEAPASDQVSALAERLETVDYEALLVETDPGGVLPAPARTCDGSVLWQVVEGGLRIAGRGGPSQAFAAAHFAGTSGAVLARSARRVAVSRDGLPLIGPLPGLPAVACCGHGALVHAHAVLAARWAVEAALNATDPAPARFRAARTPRPEV